MPSIEAVDERDGLPGRIVYGDDEYPVRQGPVPWGVYQPARHGVVERQLITLWILVDATLPLSIEAVDERNGLPGTIVYGDDEYPIRQGPVQWGGYQHARNGLAGRQSDATVNCGDATLPLSVEAVERDGRAGIIVYGDDEYSIRQGPVPWGRYQPARHGVVDGVATQELRDQGVRPRPVGNHHQ